MSSRRLLNVLEFGLPEECAFKAAAERGGQWPKWQQMLAESVNEQLRMRATYHAAHSTDDNDVRFDPSEFFFIDPALQELYDEQAKAEEDAQQQVISEFEAEAGLSV